MPDTYTYTQVIRVTPSGGSVVGGEPVTITGFGFDSFFTGSVTFDGIAATSVVVVSNTTITAVTPTHNAGAVDVVVSGIGTLEDGYTYAVVRTILPRVPVLDEKRTLDGVELAKFLMAAKKAIETAPIISGGQIVGPIDPDLIPQLPYTRIDLTTSPRLLGRTTAGAGEAEQISVAGGLSLSGGVLSMAGLPSGFVVGDLLYAITSTQLARLADVSVGSYLRSGGVATAPLWSTLKLPNAATSGDILKASGADVYASAAPQALSKVDDTNVTLTLGGTPASALVNATSLTLGWTGTLSVARGGTGTGTAFTTGSVIFAGASGTYSQDNANFFWDDVNDRLGIKTASPSARIDILNGTTEGLRIAATNDTPFAIMLNNLTFGSTDAKGFGFLQSNAGVAQWWNNNNLSVSLDTSGQVGVKVATPATALDVGGTLRIRTASGTDAVDFFSTTASALKWVFQLDTNDLGIYDPNVLRFTFQNGGRFGVGVASPTAIVHLKAGTTVASSAPLKFTSGSLLTAAEAGAVEFLTDDYYATITTGAARKGIVLNDGTALTSGRVPFATTNGRLTDDSDMTFATDTLTVTKVSSSQVTLSNTINLIATGAAATVGTATLVAGTVTVNTTAMTATAVLFTQRKTAGGTVGFGWTYTQVNNTSFTVTSDSALDTSTFVWMIVESH